LSRSKHTVREREEASGQDISGCYGTSARNSGYRGSDRSGGAILDGDTGEGGASGANNGTSSNTGGGSSARGGAILAGNTRERGASGTDNGTNSNAGNTTAGVAGGGSRHTTGRGVAGGGGRSLHPPHARRRRFDSIDEDEGEGDEHGRKEEREDSRQHRRYSPTQNITSFMFHDNVKIVFQENHFHDSSEKDHRHGS
jgi:hypothetical protein